MTSAYLADDNALAQLCAEARAQGRIALDTEFHREGRFYPKLALL